MRKADIISGILLCMACLGIIFFVIPSQTSPGEDYGVAPAFLPKVAMIIIAGLSFLLLVQSIFFPKTSGEPTPIKPRNWRHIGVFSALLFLSLGAIAFVGFVPGGALTIATFMLFLGERRPIPIGLVSLFTPLILYLLLGKLLNLPLP